MTARFFARFSPELTEEADPDEVRYASYPTLDAMLDAMNAGWPEAPTEHHAYVADMFDNDGSEYEVELDARHVPRLMANGGSVPESWLAEARRAG